MHWMARQPPSLKPLALPMTASVSSMYCAAGELLGLELGTLIDPPRNMRHEPESDLLVSLESDVYPSHDPQGYETYRLLVAASDGAQIPVTMAHRKGLV
jgi:protease II